MKTFAICILLIQCFNTHAQRFGAVYTSGYVTRKLIERSMDKEIKTGQDKSAIPSFSKKINGDTLFYRINHDVDPFSVMMVFNIKDSFSNKMYCGFQEYSFDCTPCSQTHLKELISAYNFRIKAENVYWSKPIMRTEMTITYKSDNKDCLIVRFSHLKMAKRKYKAVYKSLKPG
jgi:hypothetical protein